MIAGPRRCKPKNNTLQPTLSTALKIKAKAIVIFCFPLVLFQTIRAEMVARVNKTVHTTPITLPGGVNVGNLRVRYHCIPKVVTKLPQLMVATVIRGITTWLGLSDIYNNYTASGGYCHPECNEGFLSIPPPFEGGARGG